MLLQPIIPISLSLFSDIEKCAVQWIGDSKAYQTKHKKSENSQWKWNYDGLHTVILTLSNYKKAIVYSVLYAWFVQKNAEKKKSGQWWM